MPRCPVYVSQGIAILFLVKGTILPSLHFWTEHLSAEECIACERQEAVALSSVSVYDQNSPCTDNSHHHHTNSRHGQGPMICQICAKLLASQELLIICRDLCLPQFSVKGTILAITLYYELSSSVEHPARSPPA